MEYLPITNKLVVRHTQRDETLMKLKEFIIEGNWKDIKDDHTLSTFKSHANELFIVNECIM